MSETIMVPLPSAVSAEGEHYNKIYMGGEFYEFHSWPYSELPPVPTEVRVSEYEFAGEATTEEGVRQVLFSKRKEVKDGNTTSKP
jgi:hypothetical protein